MLPTVWQQQLSTTAAPFLQRNVQWAAVTNTVGPGGLLKDQIKPLHQWSVKLNKLFRKQATVKKLLENKMVNP